MKGKKAKADIPAELDTVWDADIAQAFQALSPQRQNLLLVYLRTGNAAEAYRKAYNPLAGDHLASNAGNQALETIGIQAILKRFEDQKTGDLFKIVSTIREMMDATKPEWVQDENDQWVNAGDAPDWKARKDAIDAMTKLRGFNSPEKVQDDRLTALLTHMNRTKEESNGKEARTRK